VSCLLSFSFLFFNNLGFVVFLSSAFMIFHLVHIVTLNGERAVHKSLQVWKEHNFKFEMCS